MDKQISKWDSSITEKLDMSFLDGPFPAGEKSDIEGIFPPYYEWFQFNKDFTEYNPDKGLSFIVEYMEKNGPFDGLLGFSQVLRMPVTGVLIDKESRKYKGIQTASGQYLFSQKLVVNASIMLSSSLSSSLAELRVGEIELGDVCVPQPVPLSEDILLRTQEMQSYAVQHPPRISLKVARSVCITNQSLQSEISTLLVVFPPRSVCSGHRAAIRALQLGSNTSVCPQGVFVVYFSTLCSDIAQGKEALNAAIDSLFILPNMTHSEYENASLHEDVTSKRRKPTLLWSVFFVQHLAENLSKPIAMCCMPDGTLDYRGLVMSTTKMFQDLFPTEELFPQKLDSEDTVENGDNYNGDLLI